MKLKIVVLVSIVLLSAMVNLSYADQQFLDTRDNLPTSNNLKIDESFKTNIFTGAFIYSYNIEVPRGTNNLQPSISLFYVNQKTTETPGVLGTAWDFTQSYIERDANSTLNTTGDDKFMLVLEGNSYDLVYTAPDRFHTDVETFFLIENESTGNNQRGMYWLVKTKDGTQYRFGFNNNSEVNSSNFAAKWYLDLVIDTYNNSVFYNYLEDPYQNDTNATYLSNITYNNDQKRLIKFIYEDSLRPDLFGIYKNGNKITYARRLKEISITVNNSLVRKYIFSYKITDTNMHSFISNITQYGSDGQSNLPATTFDYYPAISAYYQNTTWNSPVCIATDSGYDAGTRLADVNGDGLVDILRGFSDNSCRPPNYASAYINNGNGFTKNSTWDPPICFTGNPGSPPYYDVGTRIIDVNGDGLVDLIHGQGDTSCEPPTYKWAYINNGNGWTENSNWTPPRCFTNTNGVDQSTRFAELNGDGLPDLIVAWSGSVDDCPAPYYTKSFINNGNGWTENSTWLSPICFTGNSKDAGTRIVDINGDGLDDIIRGHGNDPACPSTTTSVAYLNTGNGWASTTNWNPPTCFSTGNGGADIGTRLVDLNQDGLVDIIRASDSATCEPPNINRAYLNNRNGWTENLTWSSPRCFTNSASSDVGTRQADFNGDGLVDIMAATSSLVSTCEPSQSNKTFVSNVNSSYLLVHVKNSLGGSLSIEYMPTGDLNKTGNDSTPDMGFNLWLVSEIIQSNGMNGASNITSVYRYNYSGGFYDYMEKEFRGFSYSEETRPDNTKIKHYFHQDKARTGREFKTEIFDSQDSLYQRKESEWNYTINGSIYVTELRKENSSTFDGLGGAPKVSAVNYSYDIFGNVLERNFLGDVDVSGDERYESFNYVYNETSWIVDKVKNYSLFNSTNTKLRESKFSYDNLSYGVVPIKGSITTKEDYLSTGSVVTRFNYETHGNVVNKTDPNGRTTTYSYGTADTTFTFPDNETNAKGFVTKYTYNVGLGKVLSVTDTNNFVTNFTYDVFGRISKEIRPYDTASFPTKEYVYEMDGVAPEKVKVLQRETNGTNSTFNSYQFVDGFGSNILSKQESESGQIRTDIFYDKIVRAERKSNPYLTSSSESYSDPDLSINKTNFTYDPVDRVIKIVNPDNTTKTFNHTKWNVTITDENGNRIVNVLDAFGQITEVHEYNGNEEYITRYFYDATGNLVKIIDNQGNNFTFVYDSLGRKIGMTDPDMGTWNYTYDAAGNLVSQIDGRAKRTDFSYDELNRITKRNSSSEHFNFTYDVILNSTLTNVKGVSYSSNFSYDNRLRKTSEIKIISGNVTTTNYTYDSLDRLTKITLPNSDTINYTYNSQNQIESIAGIITNIDYTELNTVLGRTYNNSLVTNFTYDPQNIRLRRIKTGGFQDLNYTYDNASNVIRINDSINSIVLDLSYDNLHRLVYAKRTDNGRNHENFTINYTYNSIGNIINVTSNNLNTIVRYQYGPIPAHAPSQVIQSGPTLQLTNLQLLETNGTVKVYRFDIANNGASNLTNISWTFYTGESQVNSTFLINLTPSEDIFVFLAYNYTNVTANYKTVAIAYINSLFDIETSNTYLPDPNATNTFVYDANGNLLQDSIYFYEYSRLNQLNKVRLGAINGTVIEEYIYDENNQRVLKKSNNESTLYVNDNFVTTINASGTFNTVYYYDKDTLVARKDPNGQKFFYHPDHLGSTTLVTNQTGNIVEEIHYYPYGLPMYDAESRYLYTGKELDRTTNLQYFGARYYDPQLGRFVEPDPIIQDIYDPQVLNSYAYTRNNPYKYIDKTGNDFGLISGPVIILSSAVIITAATPFIADLSVAVSQQLSMMIGGLMKTPSPGPAVNPTSPLSSESIKGPFKPTSTGPDVQSPSQLTNTQSPLEQISSNTWWNRIIQSENKDYDIAKSGGKHSGFLKNYEDKKVSEIESGIKTIEQRVAEHEQKLNNPAKYDTQKNWYQKTSEQQKNLINTWKKDISRQKEQINILKGILKSKGVRK